MIGIRNIGVYIPKRRISTIEEASRLNLSTDFLERKIGVYSLSRKEESERASDLCVSAFNDLLTAEGGFDRTRIDFICVCTQNGDYQLPQTSALVHAKLGFPTGCASFDISLGCSGYVYSLHVAKSFMEANDMKAGLLFTSDPYSHILNPNDKDTYLLFGDAAAVTLLTENPMLTIGRGVFGTDGSNYEDLIRPENETLYMNGRGIFNFAMKCVPINMERCLELNGLKKEDIGVYLFHQATKYIIDNLAYRMKLPQEKVPFMIKEYGNTVSSSIPLMLKNYLFETEQRNMLLCGFGVGLSIASTILRRI